MSLKAVKSLLIDLLLIAAIGALLLCSYKAGLR